MALPSGRLGSGKAVSPEGRPCKELSNMFQRSPKPPPPPSLHQHPHLCREQEVIFCKTPALSQSSDLMSCAPSTVSRELGRDPLYQAGLSPAKVARGRRKPSFILQLFPGPRAWRIGETKERDEEVPSMSRTSTRCWPHGREIGRAHV